jgi:lipoprotein-releasing system permease protein
MMIVCGYGNRFATKSEKNFGFNGHIIISNYDNNQSEVALVPISKQDFYPKFDVGVSHIQAIASKAGIIRTENAFEGIVLKVWGDYKWDNIKEYLTAGKLPDFLKM